MVVRRQRMMEDEEDLEALRLAALQTIKPRQTEPKKMYGHQYYKYNQYSGQQNKKPFIRTDYHNPNLIVIVPTEDSKVVTEAPEVQKSADVVKNGSTSDESKPVKTPAVIAEKPVVEVEPAPPAAAPSPPPIKEPSIEPSPSKVTPKSKRESKDDVMELHFDEEELDFESECVDGNLHEDEAVSLHVDEADKLSLHDDDAVALHDDDDDSLEKLMDEMEQEFSKERDSEDESKVKKKVAPKRVVIPPIEAKKPTVSGAPVKEEEKQSAAPKLAEKNALPTRECPSPKRISPQRRTPPSRRDSPIRRSPPSQRVSPRRGSLSPRPYGAARSPMSRRSRSPSYRRSRSPPLRSPPPLLRRSPLPRRSRSPLPLRSRSPFPRRSKSPYRRGSPYRKSKSPIRRRTPPSRRFSPLPRRSPRRSPLPLARRSRSRSRTPPRREYRSRSPLPLRRRSRSPSFLRRSLSKERRRPVRRSMSPRKRSPSPLPTRAIARRRTPPPRRSPNQTRPVRRRSVTPPPPLPSRRVHPRRLSPKRQTRPAARSSEMESRSERQTRGQSPSDVRNETEYGREPLRKLGSEKENDKKTDVSVEVDLKLEARRKKFEVNAPLSLTPKKIYLKTSNDETTDASENRNRRRYEDASGEEQLVKDRPKRSTSPPSRAHKSIYAEGLTQSSNLAVNTTKGSQTKSLIYEERELEEVQRVKPVIHYTVEDAKEEIELMKQKRRRKTEQILEEEGENQQLLALKKKKKKEKKEKKRSKKKEMELVEVVEAKAKTSRSGAARSGASEGQDLRAELSRRRAQRLQGQPGSRLIQSALEGVVADKKMKSVRRDSPPPDTGTVDDANKTKGRRVHVVPLAPKKKYEAPVDVNSSSDSGDEQLSDGDNAETTVQQTKRVAGILRGTTLRRRNQV